MTFDEVDAALVDLLATDARVNAVDGSAQLGIARSTFTARLERLLASGAVTLTPSIDPDKVGFGVTAFISAEIRQNHRNRGVIERLTSIPEVVEVHTVTGGSDLLIRVVARSNRDLQSVIDRIAAHDDVLHTSTSIALDTPIALRTQGLLRRSLETPQDPA